MKQEFRVLAGSPSEIEYQLNQLAKEYIVNITGVSGNESSIIVIVDIFNQ